MCSLTLTLTYQVFFYICIYLLAVRGSRYFVLM